MVVGAGCAFVAADYLCNQYKLSRNIKAAVSIGAMVFVLFMEMTLFIIRAGKFDVLDRRRQKMVDSRLAVPGMNLGLVPPGASFTAKAERVVMDMSHAPSLDDAASQTPVPEGKLKFN